MTLGVLVCELQVSTRQVHELSSSGPEPPTSHVQNGLVDGRGGIQGESESHRAEGPDRPRLCWGAKQLDCNLFRVIAQRGSATIL